MQLKEPLQDWVTDLIGDEVVSSGDVIHEAQENLRRFNLTHEQAALLRPEDICHFVETLIDLRRQSHVGISARKRMMLYVWFDEMSGSLCTSSITAATNVKLPFACEVETCTTIDRIAQDFLKSPFLESIPLSELVPIVEAEPPEETVSTCARDPLPVFVVVIP